MADGARLFLEHTGGGQGQGKFPLIILSPNSGEMLELGLRETVERIPGYTQNLTEQDPEELAPAGHTGTCRLD